MLAIRHSTLYRMSPFALILSELADAFQELDFESGTAWLSEVFREPCREIYLNPMIFHLAPSDMEGQYFMSSNAEKSFECALTIPYCCCNVFPREICHHLIGGLIVHLWNGN